MNPMFDHSSLKSRSKWITVSNLPREANEDWLRMLFAPAGIVESVNFALEEGAGTACLLFATADQASDALQFNGFNALGITLQVRPRSFAPESFHQIGQDPLSIARRNLSSGTGGESTSSMLPRIRNHFGQIDNNNTHKVLGGGFSVNNNNNSTHHNHLAMDTSPTHKNLYVLNLPLDATTDQLTALFASYGSVVHCVILAMLDAQARRRGFIDMSSSNEAKEAIEGLNGFVWHGYPIEVSYAIVQRSGGPFDQGGRNIIKRNVPRNRFNTGPRRIPSDSAIDPNLMANLTQHFNRHLSIGQIADPDTVNAIAPAQSGAVVDPYTIFIAGMDPAAIIDDDDFRSALEHYGAITAATLCRDENGMSRGFGIVTFATQQAATNVCESVNGKWIDGRRLTAHKYVYQPSGCQGVLNSFSQKANPFGFVSSAPSFLMPMRYSNGWPNVPSYSPVNRFSQGPVVSQTGKVAPTATTFDFFKPNTGNHAVEIKPAPSKDTNQAESSKNSASVKTLGEPFNPTTKAGTNEMGRHQILSRTPIVSSGSPWSTSTNATPNSLGLDGMSPHSVTSSTSSLQTPEVLRDRDTARIWSHGNGTWNPNNKHANLTGSAILSLQSDIVEKKNRPTTMAPVGHEKTSSPLRIRAGHEANGAH